MEHVNYRSLIEKSPLGFALNKIILNEEGIPCDYEILEVNAAYLKATGRKADCIGKRITELFPDYTERAPNLIKVYGEVALQGEEKEFEHYAESVNRWFKVTAFSLQKGYFIIWLSDITEELRDIEEKNILLATMNDIILELDEDLTFTGILHCKEDYLFLPRDQILGKKVGDIFSGVMKELFTDSLQNAYKSGQKQHLQYMLPLSGQDMWFEAEIFIREGLNNKKKYIVSIRDITERKKVEEELNNKTNELKRFFEVNPDLLCIADFQGNFISINSAWERLLGFPASVLEKRRFLDYVHPDDMEATLKALSRLGQNKQVINFVNRYLCQDGSYKYIEWCSQPYGKLIYAAARDITERKQAENRILYLSFHDQLTGLYNRRYYEDELKKVNIAANLPISLIMADVNGLKLANDAFGHLAGDQLLKRTASAMKKVCDTFGFAARIGGDEFVIVLPKTDHKTAQSYVDRLMRSISGKKTGMLNLSVSFGFATKTVSSEDITEVFKKAEENMYNCKLTESPRWKLATINHIFDVLYQKVPYEKRHSEEVSRLCFRMGEELHFNNEDLMNLQMASLYHDIGKIMINSKVLEKPGRLSRAERLTVEKHVIVGYQILNSISDNYHISQVVLHHHERWDGSGYPDGLAGEAIPIKSRIIAIAEAFDTMVSDQPYRKALNKEKAIEEIVSHSGTQFDPGLTGVLIKVITDKN